MKLRLPLLLGLASFVLTTAIAEAQSLRFTTTVPGGIAGTGNTLGLSKATNANGPGDRDSIGTFITLGNTVDEPPTDPNNPWPMGTTADWKLNGSSAMLELPEAEILYAELLWGGSFQYGTEDVTASLNDAVWLDANGTKMMVSPDPATALTISETAASGFAVRYYMRSANVTDIVKQAGKGMYAVGGVPATQASTVNNLNAAGWTLVVAYRDEAQPMKNLSVFVGGSFVDENTTQDYSVSGFCAPPSGIVEGSVIVSTIEGDANFAGDQLLIAPTAAGPFVNLAGPNNPQNNFFCSQINNASGMLDTQGTFGTKNQDAMAGANVSGGRQGWDITTVPLSSADGQLNNSQSSAVIRTLTTNDSYMPILAAFSIDVNAPDFKGVAASVIDAPPSVLLGDSFTVTATLANNGGVAAQQIEFSLPLDTGLSLKGFAIDGTPGDANGNMVTAAALAQGAPVGNLPPNTTKTVTVDLDVTSPPKLAGFFLKAKWAYGFEVCPNKPLVPESFNQSKFVAFAGGGGSGGAGGAGGSGTGGSSSGTGGTGGAGGSGTGGTGGEGTGGNPTGGNGDTGETGSCACSVPGQTNEPASFGALSGLGLLFGLWRARRARKA